MSKTEALMRETAAKSIRRQMIPADWPYEKPAGGDATARHAAQVHGPEENGVSMTQAQTVRDRFCNEQDDQRHAFAAQLAERYGVEMGEVPGEVEH